MLISSEGALDKLKTMPCAETVDEETSLWKVEESSVTGNKLSKNCDYKISGAVDAEALAGRDYCSGAVFGDDGGAGIRFTEL